MSSYGTLPTIKVVDPDRPDHFLIINASEWGDGKAYHPDLYPLWTDEPAPPAPTAPAAPQKGKK